MKMKPEHFTQLECMINHYIYTVKKQYILGLYILNSGLSAKRMRWDFLYSTPTAQRTAWFDEVYKYANDEHIDTALRLILPL